MKIPVVWWNSEGRGSWSCCHMLNEIFDLYDCEHFVMGQTFTSGGWEDMKGAIIVIHGGNAQLDGMGPKTAMEINEFAAPLAWAIFVNIGDETSEFPIHLLQHPNYKLWQQAPLPSQRADRYLTEGYTAGTKRLAVAKDLDWFFSGQVTHDRRIDCYKALRNIPNGELRATNGFGQGYPHEAYIELMNRAKIVPCPSGPATPDSFRMAEALECGAVPIIDAVSLNPATLGFWDVVLPGHPFRVVSDWGTLPSIMTELLADYDHNQRVCQFWWKWYKLDMRGWLMKDLIQLGAR